LVYSGNPLVKDTYLNNSRKYCRIVLDKLELNFASGVYIYAIKSGNDIYKGKLVIFND